MPGEIFNHNKATKTRTIPSPGIIGDKMDIVDDENFIVDDENSVPIDVYKTIDYKKFIFIDD